MLLIEDIRLYLKVLSWKKVCNVFLLKSSFYFSKLFKKPMVWGKPMAISIEPTTACNLECPACPSGLKVFTRSTGNMKEATFEKIIESLQSYLLHINFYFQGEPLIHPKIYKWIHDASQKNIYTLISTNAHFFNKENCQKIVESGLHKMILSIDGMSQQTYEQYRVKGKLKTVMEGIENLLEAKQQLNSNTPVIVLQWIVFQHNLEETELFKQYCKDKQLYFQIKTAQVYSEEQREKLVPKDEKYTRYDVNTPELRIKNTLRNDCWRMWASCVFTQDGMVVPCCFDKDAKYEMGDIKKQDFKVIWHSEKYTDFRKKILNARKSIDICTNCSEGANVFKE